MSDQTLITLGGFLVALIAIMAPIVKLNGNITELNVLFRELKSLVEDKTDNLDKRVTEHGKEIDDIRIKQIFMRLVFISLFLTQNGRVMINIECTRNDNAHSIVNV